MLPVGARQRHLSKLERPPVEVGPVAARKTAARGRVDEYTGNALVLRIVRIKLNNIASLIRPRGDQAMRVDAPIQSLKMAAGRKISQKIRFAPR